MKSITRLSPRSTAAWLSLGVVAGSLWLTLPTTAQAKDEKNPPVHIETDKTPLPRDGKFTSSFSHVVKKVSPSVVKVYSTVKSKIVKGRGGNPLLDDPTLRRFFGEGFGEGGGGGGGRNYRTPREQGLGSGVVISKDGYILTNNHVVENADEIKVAIGDGDKDYTATVIGRDDKTDIAVLKVDASDLIPIITTDSDAIEVGDVVLAVGNPFGIGQTVTMGLVSATGRSALGLLYENFIQTDAPINPGNSGGALIDSQGRLIGINTAILSRSGGNQGIGFAVPVNLAKFVMESIVKDGRVVRGFMGLQLQPMTSALARQFKLADTSGALVAEVQANTPAAKAGLKDGDVILELDGHPVKNSHSLRLQVSQTPPGTKISLRVLREGEKRKVDLVLKELPDNLMASNEKDKSGSKSDALDGVTVGDLDKATRGRRGIPSEIKGVVVLAIEENSASAEAGLKVGDIIREINRQPVTTTEEAIELSEKIKEDTVLLRVWSTNGDGPGSNRYVVVQEEKRK